MPLRTQFPAAIPPGNEARLPPRLSHRKEAPHDGNHFTSPHRWRSRVTVIMRAVIVSLCWLLAGSALAASPAIDGAAVAVVFENDAGSTTSISAVLTTLLSPDIIVCAVSISNPQGGPNKLTGCTGTGLSFTLRKQYGNDMSTFCTALDVNPCNVNVEVWEAVASGTLSGVTITANFTSPLCQNAAGHNGCRASLVTFGVNGVASTSTPHDPNASVPSANFSQSGTVVSATTVTTNADDLLVWYFGGAAEGNAACAGGSTAPSSPAFTMVGNIAFPTSNCLHVAVLSVSSTVNTTYTTGGSSDAWNVIVDAFTADTPPPLSGSGVSVWVDQ
jgi:hypothetical protein